jgi:putative transposase
LRREIIVLANFGQGLRFEEFSQAAVHHGTATALTAQRAITLDAAFAAHPTRFKGVAPKPPALPAAAWINPPKKEPAQAQIKPVCSLN